MVTFLQQVDRLKLFNTYKLLIFLQLDIESP
jgi:hypothetical protein